MIGKKMQDALNKQINAELHASYLYLAMAGWLESANFRGLAGWMRVQSREETGHAMRIFDFLVDRGGTVTLSAIAAPPAKWPSPLAAFEDAYKHEQKVTAMIDKLVALAEAENDKAAAVFLQWFVGEQVEEEASVDAVVRKLTLAGDVSAALLMLDEQLGRRGKD